MRLKINYTTTYTYDSPVPYALQQLRMTPKTGPGQTVLAWDLSILGGQKQVAFEDQFRNHTDLIAMDTSATELQITCTGEVETTSLNGVIGKNTSLTPLWVYGMPTEATTPGPEIRKLAQDIGKEQIDNDIAKMHRLSEVIRERVRYTLGQTDSSTNAEEALMSGHGVCQDHAQIMISAACILGYPARYVSGYLMMNDRVDQDASHAWCEVFVGTLGWVGFDVSNGYSPDDRYVRVAVGRDYHEASPVRGVRLGNSQERLCVSLQVQQ